MTNSFPILSILISSSYKTNANAAANFNVHAIVLYEEEVKIDKIGNELVIV